MEGTVEGKKMEYIRMQTVFSFVTILMLFVTLVVFNQNAFSSTGLRVIVHGGEGQVCVTSSGEGAGCKFANGGTLEFEFSPGAVQEGQRFRVCDDNDCISRENSAEKAPEHVYLSGSGNDDDDKGNFRVLITFIEGSERRHIDYIRVYVQEYPQYDFRTDLDDAFYNDDPYTGEHTSQIEMPSGLIESGETFHICIDDEDVDTTLACYKLENSRRNAPEELTINFNNFP